MKDVVSRLNKEGYLVSSDFIKNLPDNFDMNIFLSLLKERVRDEVVVLNKDILLSVLYNKMDIKLNWNEFDNSKVLLEKGKDGEHYHTFVDLLNYEVDESKREKLERIMVSVKREEKDIILEEEELSESNVIVLKSYKEDARKRNVEDFTSYFRKRFEAISGILKNRQELKDVISLSRLSNKRDGERVCIIGMVTGKRLTKNDNIMMKIEDLTGWINVVVGKRAINVFNEVKDVCEDEVVGVIGIKNGEVIYLDELILPDVPLSHGIKKCDEEVYCAFISDLHVGNNAFLTREFESFLKWINNENDEKGDKLKKDIIEKLKYLFIGGDLVDGVGIYVGQEEDLTLKDIYKQYDYFTELIKRVPRHIKIIICPGNHDALRLTEPQPVIGMEYCKELLKLDNVYMVSNPAIVNIHSSINFSGFDILLYHGASFNYYIDNIESIRLNGGYKRADLIMQYLLRMRHLAPTHISTSYIPNPNADYLVIDKVPDFFVTGHIHRLSVSNYRGVSLINASCWMRQTSFQEKIGLVPQPGKVVIVNLQTREFNVLNFMEEDNSVIENERG